MVSPRLEARVRRDFAQEGSADEVLRLLAEVNESERVQAAIVLWAAGEIRRLRDSVNLTAMDWRDVLVRGGLADEDWAARLEAELGPARLASVPLGSPPPRPGRDRQAGTIPCG